MVLKKIILLIFGLSLWTGASAQSKFFVTESGAGNMTGSSWANAASNLSKMLESANANDTVWVASGIYSGGFVMKDGVQVYGGFKGDEGYLHQRMLPGTGQNLTILDGEMKFRVLTQLVSFSSITVWDGFVIQNGQSSDGGGIYLLENGVVRRSIIRNNVAGMPAIGEYLPTQGGVVCRVDQKNKAAYVLATQNFGRNYQVGVQSVNPLNTLDEALADMDGDHNSTNLSSSRAVQLMKQYRAEAPAAEYDDWYIPSAGEWAMFLTDDNGDANKIIFATVEKTLLENNKAPLSGERYWSSTTATKNNTSSAWYVDFKTSDVNTLNAWQYNKIRGIRSYDINLSSGKGGGIFATKGSCVEGCLIMNNTGALGSAICARGDVKIINSTIVFNKSESASVSSSAIDGNSAVSVINSIITGNLDANQQPANSDARISYQYSAIQAGSLTGNGNIILGDILAEDGVLFADANNSDFQLMETSPCISKGNQTLIPLGLNTDLAGLIINTNEKINIGAFNGTKHSSIEDNELDRIKFYPNPVRRGEHLLVEIDASVIKDDTIIEIRDVLGSLIYSAKAETTNSIKMSNETGVHFLHIVNSVDAKKTVFKILITG